MSAKVSVFDVWAGSGKNLVAAIYAVDNAITLREHIDSIEYKVVDITPTSPDADQTGAVPIEAMLVAPVDWNRNREGYSFLWMMPGDLVPTPNHRYRIILTFTIEAAFGGESFLLVWEARTKDPEA